jgi:hypothetical protein
LLQLGQRRLKKLLPAIAALACLSRFSGLEFFTQRGADLCLTGL